jgi:methyl halide transferase
MFDKNFWDNYYENNHTPWDIGSVSPPLQNYIDQITDKNIKILIPGAGNAYEAEYLWEQGFKNFEVVDISALPLQNLKKRVPSIDENKLIQKDFFSLDNQYDLIIEQTFFCALQPAMRQQYAKKMSSLLKPGGKLMGLLFIFPLDLNQETPPFGGSIDEYLGYFANSFKIHVLEIASNSHPARMGREAFILLQKNNNLS